MAYEIKIENKYGSGGRKYYAYCAIPKVASDDGARELTTHEINRYVFWRSNTVANNGSTWLRYSQKALYGFLGTFDYGKVSIVNYQLVELGFKSKGGTDLVAAVLTDQGDEIDKIDNDAPNGTFTIACKETEQMRNNYVVGLAIEVAGEPCAVASVPFRPGDKYRFAPTPLTSTITIARGEPEVGQIQKDLKSRPFACEPKFTDDDRPFTFRETSRGHFEPNRQSSDTNVSFYLDILEANLMKFRKHTFPSESSRSTAVPPTNPRSPSMPFADPAPKKETPPADDMPRDDATIDADNELIAYEAISKFNKDELSEYWKDDELKRIAKQVKNWYKPIMEIDELHIEMLPRLLFLALYDCILLLDDSSSMRTQDKGRRIGEMKKICEKIVEVNCLFENAKGVKIEFLNSTEHLVAITKPIALRGYFEPRRFSGWTKLGTALKTKILDPLVLARDPATERIKPRLVSIITDGEPYGEERNTLEKVLIACKDELVKTAGYGNKTVVFQISQVGTDKEAEKFLHQLEHVPKLKGIIDVTSNDELQKGRKSNTLQPLVKEEMTVKMLAGALLVDFDAYRTEDWDPEKRAGNA